MKLLILTQKIDKNDDVLGFMHRWISEFANSCEHVTVVGLSVGVVDLPTNVRTFSLGKEKNVSRVYYLINFYRIIWNERKNYDAVFVHMNPEYVVLGGLLWRLMGKKIGLWYTHKQVNLQLRLATLLTNIIFTASPESFRFLTPKSRVVGHGIDTERFGKIVHVESSAFRIVSIGRLSRTKGYETLLDALILLKTLQSHFVVTIVGGPLTPSDEAYLTELRREIADRGLHEIVTFEGAVPNTHIDTYLARADLFVNMSDTGSLDKAVLEAMSAGVLVLTSNPGLRSTLGDTKDKTMFQAGNSNEFASKIEAFIEMPIPTRLLLCEQLQGIAVTNHGVRELIPRIIGIFTPLL